MRTIYIPLGNTREQYDNWEDRIPKTHNHRLTGNTVCECRHGCGLCHGKGYHNRIDRRENFKYSTYADVEEYAISNNIIKLSLEMEGLCLA